MIDFNVVLIVFLSTVKKPHIVAGLQDPISMVMSSPWSGRGAIIMTPQNISKLVVNTELLYVIFSTIKYLPYITILNRITMVTMLMHNKSNWYFFWGG